ncbi:MAG: ATP synthase F1 subunit gamma [Deltaproteobacteria bacterium]|nr:ATP synthase F1 subunit gamma [Deltaproteobacteria bacterium]
MASAKDLRKRITSVKNTQQITRAMKMVAAAKLRRAQENIISLRPYAREINRMILALSKNAADEVEHPLMKPRDQAKSVLLIVVTSDRGLCGAFNGNVIKTAQRFLRTEPGKYETADLAFIGKKGYEFFRSRKPGKYYQGFFFKLDFKKSQSLAEELIDLYLSGKYDEIKVVYNEFKSVLSQRVSLENFLPVREEGAEASAASGQGSPITIYEPNAKEILSQLLPKHFAIQAHRYLLESLASEHAARMTAMENATKNAGEMIRKITLQYNKTRQAGITKELLEIVSGAESLKG